MTQRVEALPLVRERGQLAAAERAVDVVEGSKRCTLCKRVKLLDYFTIDRRAKDGHQCWCRTCRRIDNKRYRQTEGYRAWSETYHADPQTKAASLRRHWANKGQRRAADAAYWRTPRGHIVRLRNNVRHRLKNATTEVRRSRLAWLLTAYDAELARIEARSV